MAILPYFTFRILRFPKLYDPFHVIERIGQKQQIKSKPEDDMNSKKQIFAIALIFIFGMTCTSFAATLTVGSGTATCPGGTVEIPITVDNPYQLAGASFTITYNSVLNVAVDSTFFDTFAAQQTEVETNCGTCTWTGGTSVTVDSVTFDQPLVTNEITGAGTKSTRIAAAKAWPSDATTPTDIFTLTVTASQPVTDEPITIEATVLNNPQAGYDGDTSIDLLVGSDLSVTDPTDTNAFPVLLAAAGYEANVTSGTVTIACVTLPEGLNTVVLGDGTTWSTAADVINNTTNCLGLARWDAVNQGWQTYTPITNFDVFPGDVFFLNFSADAGFQGGSTPDPSYTLYQGLNFVMLPASRSGLSTSTDLIGDVPNCAGVSRWDGITKGWVSHTPIAPFDLVVGEAYFLNVTAGSTWP